MLYSHPYLRIRDDDTKRLREEFNDKRIYYCFNVLSQEFEAWYKPESSRPYKVSTAENVSHAARLLRNRMQYDKKRAIDILREIDEHNESLTQGKEADAIHEVRTSMRHIASGRQIFTPPLRRKANAAV